MKIAILTPWSISPNAVGGTERFVMDLAESFVRLGNSVDVYMLSGKDYSKGGINYLNMNLFDTDEVINEYFLREKFNNFNNVKSYEDLADKINKLVDFSAYDLVQLNSQLFLKVGRDKKRIFTIHTNPFEYKLDWGEASFKCMVDIMKEEGKLDNTKFVTPSKYYAKKYNEYTNININFIPHAIDVDRLISNSNREDVLSRFNVDILKKVILLPSRLEPNQKQPMVFMKAFALIPDEIKSQFVVICTGADKQYLQYKSDIEDFCNSSNIDLVITRFETMADAYNVADIVALPSKSESFGYAALESLTLGIPTILNDIPTFREITEDSKNYYFFNNNVDSLHETLIHVINSKLERVIQPDKWSNKYSIIEFGKNYIELY